MGKVILYQILPRLWGEGRMSSIDVPSLQYFRSLGVTHVWYTGIIRHASAQPFTKGDAGSPYAISDYYDINRYLADDPARRLDEFRALVARTHEAGLGLILDFVPNHVARDYGRSRVRTDLPYLGDGDDPSVHWKADNDFYYYPGEALRLPGGAVYPEYPAKATGNAFTPAPSANDWYDTVRLNYCPFHTPTWDKMLAILRYWAALGVDGFRCDMVEMVPREFFAWAIPQVKSQYTDIQFIAEVYQKEHYSEWIAAGFDLLYDKSGLYDTLRGVVQGGRSAQEVSACAFSLDSLQPHLLHFLENHDEQRFASPCFGGGAERTFAPLGVSLLYDRAPFLVYFGEECGEAATESSDGRTSIFNASPIPSLQRLSCFARTGEGLSAEQAAVLPRFRSLLQRAGEDLFSEGSTFDLGYCNGPEGGFDPTCHLAFLRHLGSRTDLLVCNFSPTPARMQLTIPSHAATCGIAPGTAQLEVGPYDLTIQSYEP